MRIFGLVSLIALLSTSIGCESPFTFDREPPLSRSAIFGSAVRDEAGGSSAAYAQINMMGTGLVRQATSDGSFALTDLGAGTYILRINDDDDGDGQPERSRLVAVSVAIANKPDGIGLGSGKELVSTSLGEVIIEGTGIVEGSVSVVDPADGVEKPPVEVGLGARALLFRTVELEGLGGQATQLGADAETHVDATGQYRFNKVLTGDFVVVVTLHNVVDGERGQTVFVSTPESISVDKDATVTATDVSAPNFDANLEDGTRDVEVIVSPAISERSTPYAIFVPPGRIASSCQVTRPQQTQFAYEHIIDATVADISRLNGAPLGVWDVRFCAEAQFVDAELGTLEDAVSQGAATIFSLVIGPSEDGVSTVLAGPVVLQRENGPCLRSACADGSIACDVDSRVLIRDCDGDNIQGIPPFDNNDAVTTETWKACAIQCGARIGVDAGGGRCAFLDQIYDCDDDGDLQTDASEPPACYGPGLGDDRDGDGLCSGEDAFPTCTANTAQACVAGIVDLNVGFSAEYSPFDASFADRGLYLEPLDAAPDADIDVVGGFTRANGAALLFLRETIGEDAATNLVTKLVASDGSVQRLVPITTRVDSFTPAFVVGDTTADAFFVVGLGQGTPTICRLVAGEGVLLTLDASYGFEGCATPARAAVGLVFDFDKSWNAGAMSPEGNLHLVAGAVDSAAGNTPALLSIELDATGAQIGDGVVVPIQFTAAVSGEPPRITAMEFVSGSTDRLFLVGDFLTEEPSRRGFYISLNVVDDTFAGTEYIPLEDTARTTIDDLTRERGSSKAVITGTIDSVGSQVRRVFLHSFEIETEESPSIDVTQGFFAIPNESGSNSPSKIEHVGEEYIVVGVEEDENRPKKAIVWRVDAERTTSTVAFIAPDLGIFGDERTSVRQVFSGPGAGAFVAGQHAIAVGLRPVGIWAAKLRDVDTGEPNEPGPQPPETGIDSNFGNEGVATLDGSTLVASVPLVDGSVLLFVKQPARLHSQLLNRAGTNSAERIDVVPVDSVHVDTIFQFNTVIATETVGVYYAIGNYDNGATTGAAVCQLSTAEGDVNPTLNLNFNDAGCIFDVEVPETTVKSWGAISTVGGASDIVVAGFIAGVSDNRISVTTTNVDVGLPQTTEFTLTGIEGDVGAPVFEVQFAGIVARDVTIAGGDVERRIAAMGTLVFSDAAPRSFHLELRPGVAPGNLALLNFAVAGTSDSTLAMADLGNNFLQGVGVQTVAGEDPRPFIWEVDLAAVEFEAQNPNVAIFAGLAVPGLRLSKAAAVKIVGNAFVVVALGETNTGIDQSARLMSFPSAASRAAPKSIDLGNHGQLTTLQSTGTTMTTSLVDTTVGDVLFVGGQQLAEGPLSWIGRVAPSFYGE